MTECDDCHKQPGCYLAYVPESKEFPGQTFIVALCAGCKVQNDSAVYNRDVWPDLIADLVVSQYKIT